MKKLLDIIIWKIFSFKTLSSVLSVSLGALCLWAYFNPELYVDEETTLAFLGIGANKRARRDSKRATRDARNYFREGELRYSNFFNPEKDGLRKVGGKFGKLAEGFQEDLSTSYADTAEGRSIIGTIMEQGKDAVGTLDAMASSGNLSNEAVIAGLGNINKSKGASLRDFFAGSDSRRSGLRGAIMAALGGQQSSIAGVADLKGAEQNMGANYAATLTGTGMNAYNQSMNRSQAATNAFMGLLGSAASPGALLNPGQS